jgi:hypothetical protein
MTHPHPVPPEIQALLDRSVEAGTRKELGTIRKDPFRRPKPETKGGEK